jgi:hypothetical protein
MPNLTEYVADPRALPAFYWAGTPAGADVAIAAGGTYYDAATLGTLQPGLYLVSGQISFLNGAGAAGFATAKLLFGTVVLASGEASTIATTGETQITVGPIAVNIAIAGVVKLQGSNTQIGTIKNVTVSNGTPGNCTFIQAIRLK